MSSGRWIVSKSAAGQFVQKYRNFFFVNVLYVHAINNQKETTVLDRQGHNIYTQTFQTTDTEKKKK